MPLTDTAIRNAAPRERPYRLADGEGMYLEVSPAGGKYWRLKYRFGGKEKRLALGTYSMWSRPEQGWMRQNGAKWTGLWGEPSQSNAVLRYNPICDRLPVKASKPNPRGR
jgi:hypothetical protein